MRNTILRFNDCHAIVAVVRMTTTHSYISRKLLFYRLIFHLAARVLGIITNCRHRMHILWLVHIFATRNSEITIQIHKRKEESHKTVIVGQWQLNNDFMNHIISHHRP